MSKILYISSEAFPLVKTGGLGDVAGSLPVALLKQSHDVRLLLPAYPEVLSKISKRKTIASASYYNLGVKIIESRLPGSQLLVWLVDCPALFDRPGGPYSDSRGHPWHDNALRYAVFCHAAVALSMDQLGLDWQPDVVHCNDWQSALVPALLSLQSPRPATVFTIHNLAYQGLFDQQTFDDLHLPPQLWQLHGLEFHNQLSFIKGGLVYADRITTVSPRYAVEILQPEFGYGLDGLLLSRSEDLSGIVNGIDEKLWNPGADDYLPEKYNRRSLHKKSLNKTALQQQLLLPVEPSALMIGMISRLVQQKGLDIILQSLPSIVTMPCQLVILGTGETHYEIQLSEWAQLYPEQIKVIIGYDECLAHRIEAASDVYLMPSTFEPCGLNQLYSLRYGTLPIVTPVGGLADTVVDASAENIGSKTANGLVLPEQTAAALVNEIQRALTLYRSKETWQQLQLTAMGGDYSWQASAGRYSALYQQVLQQRAAMSSAAED